MELEFEIVRFLLSHKSVGLLAGGGPEEFGSQWKFNGFEGSEKQSKPEE